MRRLETILRRTDFAVMIFFVVGAISLWALFLITFGDIAARFLFGSTLWGTIELSEYLLVAIAFLALAFAQLTGTHVRVEAMSSRFPARVQTIVNVLVLLVAMGFFIIMTMQIGQRAYICWSEGILLSLTTVKLPIWWPSFIGAVGCALLVIALLTQLIRNIIGLFTGKVVGFVTWTR